MGGQCDQLGRIFAQWGIVYFGQCFENYRSIANYLAIFFNGTSYVCNTLAKKLVGRHLGDFFTISSGHPVAGKAIFQGVIFWPFSLIDCRACLENAF
jgi:hypothetical protein